MLAAVFLPLRAPLPDGVTWHFLEWLLLTNAVTIAALSVVAVRTEWRGWRLGFSVALIPLAIVVINGIEGIVFLKNLCIEWPRIFLTSAITAIVSAPVWTLLFGSRRDTPASISLLLPQNPWASAPGDWWLAISVTSRCTSPPAASSFFHT
jgi:hypothetical protein